MNGVEFVGGPLCGRKLPRKSDPGLYTFTDGNRCYKRPHRGLSLYRRLEPRPQPDPVIGEMVLYLHVGHRVGLCESCGSFNQFPDGERRCQMCGHDLVADLV